MLWLRDTRSDMPGVGTARRTGPESVDRDGRSLRCAACRAFVTHPEWAANIAGGHHQCRTNPAGVTFRLRCFRQAPGLAARGPATLEHTWFPGMAWRIGHCASCGVHLGWSYAGEGDPFVALISDRLTGTEPD